MKCGMVGSRCSVSAGGGGALLIGVGNPTRSDDRAGHLVVARVLERVPAASHLLVQQLDIANIESMAAHGRVIIADASLYGFGASATLHRVEPRWESMPHGHSLSPAALLHLTRRITGKEPQAWLAAVRGFDFCFGETITEACRQGVERAADLVVDLLVRNGEPGLESRPRPCRGSTRPQ